MNQNTMIFILESAVLFNVSTGGLYKYVKSPHYAINSSGPSDAYMRR